MVSNTPSMIVGPSIILLHPHVGRFHASGIRKKSRFSAKAKTSRQAWPSSGGIAACRLLNIGCLMALYRCITSDEHSKYDCKSLHHTSTATCWQVSCLRVSGKNVDFLPTSRQAWPSSGGMAACRFLNNRCLALVRCIIRSVTLPA